MRISESEARGMWNSGSPIAPGAISYEGKTTTRSAPFEIEPLVVGDGGEAVHAVPADLRGYRVVDARFALHTVGEQIQNGQMLAGLRVEHVDEHAVKSVVRSAGVELVADGDGEHKAVVAVNGHAGIERVLDEVRIPKCVLRAVVQLGCAGVDIAQGGLVHCGLELRVPHAGDDRIIHVHVDI